jgi:Predicted membrane protein
MKKVRTITHSESFVQLIKYVLIGFLGLIVDFGVYTILTHFKMNVELANVISSTCGIINNFLWNSYTNFKVHDHLFMRFISYFGVGQITTVFYHSFFIHICHAIRLFPLDREGHSDLCGNANSIHC